MLKITLAICAYNAARYIEETLKCIANQTLQNFDLLIINDCSTDNTIDIIESVLSSLNQNYRLINLEQNGGIANARQMALEQAKTKYVVFVDADDLPHPTLLEEEYKLISSDSNIMAVSCWSEFIDEKSKRIKGGLMMGFQTKEDFINKASREKLIFLPIQTMIDREAALSVGGFNLSGFPEGKPRYRDFCEDLDLWTRMSDLYAKGRYIITIPKVLYSYRKAGGGLSANSVSMTLKMKYVKRNLKLRRAGNPELTFIDFMQTITHEELKKIERDTINGDRLRNGVMLLSKGNIFKGGYWVMHSIIANPKYFWQKIKANSRIFR
ncbi:MAG: glycosyltransferase [Rikenellaceae bacterium]